MSSYIYIFHLQLYYFVYFFVTDFIMFYSLQSLKHTFGSSSKQLAYQIEKWYPKKYKVFF